MMYLTLTNGLTDPVYRKAGLLNKRSNIMYLNPWRSVGDICISARITRNLNRLTRHNHCIALPPIAADQLQAACLAAATGHLVHRHVGRIIVLQPAARPVGELECGRGSLHHRRDVCCALGGNGGKFTICIFPPKLCRVIVLLTFR